MPNTKPILITGGAGFLGTHLARHLLALGFKVRSLDIKKPLFPIKGVTYTLGDARDKAVLTRAIRGSQSVFHLAAVTSVPVCQDNPHESYRTNFMLTCDVLEAVRHESTRAKVPVRMIFSGSSVVYGHLGKKDIGLKENTPLSQPLSFYGSQKLASEQAIKLYVQRFEIQAVVFRFFNLFGHGQDPASPYSGVITKFMDLIHKKETLQLHGGGEQTRDFVAVEDIARACALALKMPAAACNGSAINLGTGRSISIKELAMIMNAVSKSRSVLKKTPARQGDVLHSKADITKAATILKWEPRIALEEGLKNLIVRAN